MLFMFSRPQTNELPSVKQKSVSERKQFAKAKKWCFNCLFTADILKDCQKSEFTYITANEDILAVTYDICKISRQL